MTDWTPKAPSLTQNRQPETREGPPSLEVEVPPAMDEPEYFRKLDEAGFHLARERMDPQAQQQRAVLYRHMRETEGFSAQELSQLDEYPLSMVPEKSREILVERLRRAKGETTEKPEAPWVPIHQPGESTWEPKSELELTKEKLSQATKRSDRDRIRREWLKQQGRSQRKVRRTVV